MWLAGELGVDDVTDKRDVERRRPGVVLYDSARRTTKLGDFTSSNPGNSRA